MTLRILLTGKNGQVGTELCRLLPSFAEVLALDRASLDVTDRQAIRRVVREIRPNLIINAAAYTKVDQAENEESTAFAVNAEAPAILASEARGIGAALVHYSTDYVFDGLKTTPYLESDPPNPVGVYGKSKHEGERAIQNAGVPHLILRTAWVYATTGHNFLLTILRLATEREELRIVRDQIGAPTWSREIALGTMRILAPLAQRGWSPDSLGPVGGIYHMTAGGETSWHQFAEQILQELAQAQGDAPWIAAATGGKPLLTRRIIAISTSEYPTRARRPAYSVLSNALLLKTFGIQLPDWRQQLHSTFHASQILESPGS